MRVLRATTRLICLLLATALVAGVFLPGKFLLLPFPNYSRIWRNFSFHAWSNSVISILNITLNIRNTSPAGAFLLVVNHLSYLDVVVLTSQIDCTFIAKSEVSQWPLIGLLARSVSTIFINRKQRRDVVTAMRKIRHSMNAGLGVVLFAEGTSTSGERVLPFKSSLLEFAACEQLAVHYASISYRTGCDEPYAAESVCWWGDMTFPDHFWRLMQLKGLAATLTFGATPVVANDRRVLSTGIWQAVNAQFIPVVSR